MFYPEIENIQCQIKPNTTKLAHCICFSPLSSCVLLS